MEPAVRFTVPIITRVKDEAVDRILRALKAAVTELQGIRLLNGKLIEGVELPDQTNVPIRHGFGRPARAFISVPYAIAGSATSGSIRDRSRLTADEFDRNQYVVLFAEDWNTTMYVDVWVVA